ncbi:hypothetical protein Hanom_Chr04g00361781 [Helianthus anomalus]
MKLKKQKEAHVTHPTRFTNIFRFSPRLYSSAFISPELTCEPVHTKSLRNEPNAQYRIKGSNNK